MLVALFAQGVGLLVAAVLISQFVLASAEDHSGYELLQVPDVSSKVEEALKSLEAKLNEVSPTPEHDAWQAHHSHNRRPL